MRQTVIAIGLGALLLTAAGLAASVAHAGVPRSCVHPRAHRLECRADTRRVMDQVLPSARLEALHHERRDLGRVTTRSNRERNRLLRGILRELEQQSR